MKQIIVKMEQQINILKSILEELCKSINIEKEKKNKIKAIIKEMKPIIIEESKFEKDQSKIEEVNENRDMNNKRKEEKKVLQQIGNSGPLLRCAVMYKKVKINEHKNQIFNLNDE